MTRPEPDIAIAQLVFSFVCHELAGPIGAVNNGLELMADFGSGGDDEAMELVTDSAQQTARELEFARLAFGAGGGLGGSLLASVPAICEPVLKTERVAFRWSAPQGIPEPPRNVAKLLANMALVARQALRGRGVLTLRVEAADAGLDLFALAEGPGARLDEGLEQALLGDREAGLASPLAAQAYFTSALAAACGGEIVHESGGDDVYTLSVSLRDTAQG